MILFLLALQQGITYDITARLDEDAGVLAGTQRVAYINNSPDTLDALYFHLYLNAFRPGSDWARIDEREGRERFQRLVDPHFAYNHVSDVTIDGRPITPDYPHAPDSTIVRFPLPAPLAPGDSLVADMRWDARPSTLPRRQGRRGRRFDFAQWYPRVVAYDRYGWAVNTLKPAGEFYGDFATFDVTLDVLADQVIGATGVVVDGDPGWGGDGRDGRAAQRKQVTFHAEDVHHFAITMNPEYRYEHGRYRDIDVHVLYLPQDSATWGTGIVVNRTIEALRWLDELFGPYPWPQITNVHRIEGGGTEFPMMVMDGGPSLSLILHEVGHNYLMGILASSEWREGWLDEGFTSFQTTWYYEEHVPGFDGYSGDEAFILGLDLDNWSQPVSIPGHDFRDYNTYSVMTYTKGELFFHQLRAIVGHDTMRAILREYYRRHALSHVNEQDFLHVAEAVSGKRLAHFFAQWLHGTPLYDYALEDVDRRELPDGRWETTVRVRRRAEGWFPVEIGETRDGSREAVIYGRVEGMGEVEQVTFVTGDRPGRLMVDPRLVSHDYNYLNNRESRFWTGQDAPVFRLDTWFAEPARRDRSVHSILPALWYNDVGGLTLALRERSNYLGRFNRITGWIQRGLDSVPATGWDGVDWAVRVVNPLKTRTPRSRHLLEAWGREGTGGIRLSVDRHHPRAWYRGDRYTSGWSLDWIATPDTRFLPPGRWEDAGTVELTRRWGWDLPDGAAHQRLDVRAAAGLVYANRAAGGIRLNERYDLEPYLRAEGAAATRFPRAGFDIGLRLYGGLYLGESAPVRQRRILLAGANPYETLGNPFVRSVGALFVRPEVFYHAPGGANLRGFHPALGGVAVGAVNVEVERALIARRRGVLRRVALVGFADAGAVDGDAVGSSAALYWLWDAGPGLRATLRIGDVSLPLRLEFPLLVSDPTLAQDADPGERLGFRWLFSFERAF